MHPEPTGHQFFLFAPTARSDARHPAELADRSCRPGAMSRAKAAAWAGLLSST